MWRARLLWTRKKKKKQRLSRPAARARGVFKRLGKHGIATDGERHKGEGRAHCGVGGGGVALEAQKRKGGGGLQASEESVEGGGLGEQLEETVEGADEIGVAGGLEELQAEVGEHGGLEELNQLVHLQGDEAQIKTLNPNL